ALCPPLRLATWVDFALRATCRTFRWCFADPASAVRIRRVCCGRAAKRPSFPAMAGPPPGKAVKRLAGLSMRGLPASNIVGGLIGPWALIVARRGLFARMTLIRVGWQWFHSARLLTP